MVVAWNCVLTAIIVSVNTPDGLWLPFVTADGFLHLIEDHRTHNHPVNHTLPFWFYHIFWPNEIAKLSKLHKRDKSESQSSLMLDFTNIQDLLSNFLGYEFWLEVNSPDILAWCKANFQDSFGSNSIHVTVYLCQFGKILLIICIV